VSPVARSEARLPSPVDVWVTLALGLLIAIASSLIMIRFHIFMGSGSGTAMPRHVRGVFSLSRPVIVPMLCLLVVQAGMQTGRRVWVVSGVLSILGFGISVMLLEASKAGLTHNLLALLLLALLIRNKIPKILVGWIAPLFLLTPLLFTAVGSFRVARQTGYSVQDSLRVLSREGPVGAQPTGGVGGMYSLGAQGTLMRLTGADVLAVLVNSVNRPLGWEVFEVSLHYRNGFGGYVGAHVFGTTELVEKRIQALAPSLLGCLYLISGAPGVMVGMAIFTLGAALIWSGLSSGRLISQPAASTVFLGLVLIESVEGDLNMAFKAYLPIYFGTVVLTESVARLFASSPSRTSRARATGPSRLL
jgi:hypothetical protein